MKVIIVHFNGYFGQSLPTEKTLNIEEIKKQLTTYDIEVLEMNLQDVANQELKYDEKTYYLIGSHQNPSVKKFFDEVVMIKMKDVNTIPSQHHIYAHENKVVQALLNQTYNYGLVDQKVSLVANKDVVSKKNANLVNKLSGGSGSSGVFIPKEGLQYKSYLYSITWRLLNVSDVFRFIKHRILNIFFNLTDDNLKYNQNYYPMVMQSKLDTPGFDYKILVFYDKVYVLKRYVRKNDFRSSGSGNFEFVENVDKSLLTYAYNMRERLAVPYVSLDIMESNSVYNCIEYQCLHFGPYTQLFADFYYKLDTDGWVKCKRNESIEFEMSYSVGNFLKNKLNE